MNEIKRDIPEIYSKFTLAKEITYKELEILSETSHGELLGEIFRAFCDELDKNGTTVKLQEVRREKSEKLIKFWQNKMDIYVRALEEGLIEEGERYSSENETIVIYDIDEGEDASLEVKRNTKTENDEVQIRPDVIMGIDDLGFELIIRSGVKSDPEEAPNIHYELVVKNGLIRSLERLLIHTDPNHKQPFIKDKRTITF